MELPSTVPNYTVVVMLWKTGLWRDFGGKQENLKSAALEDENIRKVQYNEIFSER